MQLINVLLCLQLGALVSQVCMHYRASARGEDPVTADVMLGINIMIGVAAVLVGTFTFLQGS